VERGKQRRMIVYEIFTRPCAEGQGFFRLVCYQLAITCAQNGMDLWINSPLERTQALLLKISEKYGRAQRLRHETMGSANGLWICIPKEQLMPCKLVDDLGIRRMLRCANAMSTLEREHALRIEALAYVKWVRLPKEDALCRRVAHRILLVRKRGQVLSSKAFFRLVGIYERCETWREFALPYVDPRQVQLMEEDDFMEQEPKAWLFSKPSDAMDRIAKLMGAEVDIVINHVSGVIESIRGWDDDSRSSEDHDLLGAAARIEEEDGRAESFAAAASGASRSFGVPAAPGSESGSRSTSSYGPGKPRWPPRA